MDEDLRGSLTPALRLCCDPLLRCGCLLRRGLGGFDRGRLLHLLLFGLWWSERDLGFCEEVELMFAGDGDVSGKGEAERKARQLFVFGAVDGWRVGEREAGPAVNISERCPGCARRSLPVPCGVRSCGSARPRTPAAVAPPADGTLRTCVPALPRAPS